MSADTHPSEDPSDYSNPTNRYQKPMMKVIQNAHATRHTNTSSYPFIPMRFLPPEIKDRDKLKALKMNLQKSYMQMVLNDSERSEEFYENSRNLTNFRGQFILNELKSNSRPAPPPPPIITSPVDIEDINDYPEIIIDLQIFDTYEKPLLMFPVRQVTANHINLFTHDTTNDWRRQLVEAIMSVKWNAENVPNISLLKSKPEIEVNCDKILEDIHYKIQNPNEEIVTATPKFVGTEFDATDNTAQSTMYSIQPTQFSSPPQFKTDFQISVNAPYFPPIEAWQNWTVLKKINLDLFHCFKREKKTSSANIKVIIENDKGKKLILVWTVYRLTPDKFDITHLTYTSMFPKRSILTDPEKVNANDIELNSGDIDWNTLKIRHTQADANVMAKVDETTLMQLHAHGAVQCGGKVQELNDQYTYQNTLPTSKGWVYYYPFWTVIISSCNMTVGRIKTPSYIATQYTFIHRTSEYATEKWKKKRPLQQPYRQDQQPQASTGGHHPQWTAPAQSIPNIHHTSNIPNIYVNRNTSKRLKSLHLADTRHYPFLIFGIIDLRNITKYYYFENPTPDQRAILQKQLFSFQSKIYHQFYQNILDDLEAIVSQKPDSSTNIAKFIEVEYTAEGKTISPYPGLFLTWIKDFPYGWPPDYGKRDDKPSAPEQWTKLWDSFLNQTRTSLRWNYKIIPVNTQNPEADPVILEYIRNNTPKTQRMDGQGGDYNDHQGRSHSHRHRSRKTYASHNHIPQSDEHSDQTTHAHTDTAPSNEEGADQEEDEADDVSTSGTYYSDARSRATSGAHSRASSNRDDTGNDSDYSNARSRDHSSASSHRDNAASDSDVIPNESGRSRNSSRSNSQDSRGSSRSDTGGPRERPNGDDHGFTRQRDLPQRGRGTGRGRGRGRGRGGRLDSQRPGWSFESTESAEPSFLSSVSEDPSRISEMQHEIDMLRRSLNQLALLQN